MTAQPVTAVTGQPATSRQPAVDLDDPSTVVQGEESCDQSRSLSLESGLPPGAIPGYVFLRALGEGAFGSVWLAREQNTGKQVAVKFFTHRRSLDWSLLSREVEKLAALDSSRNIVDLLIVGWDSDPPYYVMEYLENGSLASFLADGPLPAHEAVRIARSVLQALVHAHSSGILHCDLKPGNVLLDTDFEPRICDFGQSRLTHEQDPALGTLFYMAPEQAATDTIPDARWDVYALGALLYHMLVGHAPFRTPENEQEVRRHETLEQRLTAYRKVLQDGPRPVEHRRVSGVDRRLAEIIDRCLKTDPARRFRNAQEVLNALEFRERARARRPLIALGIVGPVLLLAAMLPIARRAMQSAVDTARANLTERALESDLLSANLLARNLERELIERRAELVEVAADPALREAIAHSEVSNWNDRDSLFQIMGRHHRLLSQAGRTAEDGPIDTSWFLTDVAGYQRWREPLSQETLDRNWAHRDYFHGRNTQYQRGQLPDDLQPISRPHISIAFLSQATHLYMVAISVPVWDDPSSPNRKVIGVLARTAHLGLLLDEYRENRTASRLREISLVDQRSGIVLDHPWMTEQQMARFNRRDLPRVFSRLKVQEIRSGQPASGSVEPVRSSDPVPGRVPNAGSAAEPAVGVDRTDSYQDPVGRLAEELLVSEEGTIPGSRQLWQGVRDRFAHRWLAAFAPVGNTGWTAVVQEREDRAMLPVQQMRADLEKYGQAAIVAGFSLVGLLWYFVVRALNDRAVRVSLLRGRGRSAGTASVGSESS